jgi:hypothetical protein
MWLTKVKDETITLYSFSLTLVLCQIGLLGLQINLFYEFLSGSGLAGLTLNKIWNESGWVNILGLFPIAVIVLLYGISPLIITRIDKTNKRLSVVKYTLFGKKIREVGFDLLSSYVQSSRDYSEGSHYYWLYLKLDYDERINLCAIPTLWKWNAINTKEKAND